MFCQRPDLHGVCERAELTLDDAKFLAEEAWLLLENGAINERRRRLNDIAMRIAAIVMPSSPLHPTAEHSP